MEFKVGDKVKLRKELEFTYDRRIRNVVLPIKSILPYKIIRLDFSTHAHLPEGWKHYPFNADHFEFVTPKLPEWEI